MTITAFVFLLVFGLAMLLFGRNLFWVYLGLLGFLLGFEATRDYLATDSEWLPVLAGLVVGIMAALAAVFLQYIAVGLAGFVGGAYLTLGMLGLGATGDATLIPLLLVAIGGALGAMLFLLLFDPALVVLSALAGAGLLVQPFPLSETAAALLYLLLAVAGMLFQFLVLSKAEPPGR